MIVYEKDGIQIIKETAFGKTFLAGHNKKNGATVTSVLKCDSELMEKVAKMIIELEKRAAVDLTERLANIERKAIQAIKEELEE